MTTYRRPLSNRLAETLDGWFFSTIDHQANAVTCALGLAVVGACIIAAMVVVGNLP